MTPDGCGSSEEYGFAFAAFFFQKFENGLVVLLGVQVVHHHRIGAIVVHRVGGDALAEVGLEGVDALAEEIRQ